MKKILSFLLILILLSGCSITRMDDIKFDEIVKETLTKDSKIYNQNKIGYRYYLPRTWESVSDIDYNEAFKEGNHKYYLYVDIVSYYNKVDFNYEVNKDAYYSEILEMDDKKGYLEINKVKDYFLVEMMYNYSKIEVAAKEEDLKTVVTGGLNLLTSIQYNNSVINNLVGNNKLSYEETSYDISKPNKGNGKTFLDYFEEYAEDQSNMPEDSDVIN